MVITCNDADVCTYLENILGFRQTGDADIHADTKATADLVQDSQYGLVQLGDNVNSTYGEAVSAHDLISAVQSSLADLTSYLDNILGVRQSGQNDIHADSQNANAVVSNGTYGNSAIRTFLTDVGDDVDNIETKLGGNVGNQSTISDYLVNVLGLRQSGQVDIHADTLNANTILSALYAGTALKDRNAAAPIYPTPNAYNVAEDFVNTRTAVAIVGAVTTLLGQRLGPSPSVKGDLLQNIIEKVLDFTGVEKQVTVQDMWRGYMPAPPIDQLILDSYAAVDSQDVISIPAGCYGARFIISVPSTWGRLDTWPYYYVPAVARIDYANTGFYGFNPIGIQTDFILAYPFPSWADSMVVSLGAGVTAERAWLYLAH